MEYYLVCYMADLPDKTVMGTPITSSVCFCCETPPDKDICIFYIKKHMPHLFNIKLISFSVVPKTIYDSWGNL